MKRLAWLTLAAVVTASGCDRSTNNAADSDGSPGRTAGEVRGQSPTAAVSRDVSALGRIQPIGGIVSVAAAGMDRVQEVTVQAGDRVEAGQVIAIMETRQARMIELAAAEQQLEQAKGRISAEKKYAETLLAEARLARQQAMEAQSGELAVQGEKVKLAQTALSQAQAALRRLRESGDAVSRFQVEQQEQTVERAEQEVALAELALQNLRDIAVTNEKLADAKVASAEAQVTKLEESADLSPLEAQVRLAQEQLAATEVKAPVEGVILKIGARAGELVGGAQPVAQIANTTRMQVVAEVYENDIWRVRMGDPVDITSPAFPPGEKGAPVTLQGRVARIGQAIERNEVFSLSPAADADLRVFRVEIELLDETVPVASGLAENRGGADGRLSQHQIAAMLINLQVTVHIDRDE